MLRQNGVGQPGRWLQELQGLRRAAERAWAAHARWTWLTSAATAGPPAMSKLDGRAAGALESHRSTAEKPGKYFVRTADVAALPHASVSSTSHQSRTTSVLRSLVKSSLDRVACCEGVQVRDSPSPTWHRPRRLSKCPGCLRPALPTTWPRQQRSHTRRTRHTWKRQACRVSWGRECGQHWQLRQLQAHELQVGVPVLVQAHLLAASRTAALRSGPSATRKGQVSLPCTARQHSLVFEHTS